MKILRETDYVVVNTEGDEFIVKFKRDEERSGAIVVYQSTYVDLGTNESYPYESWVERL